MIDAGTLSPRFSTVYDLKGDGRQLITFNAGRFFVQTAQQLVNTNLQEDWNGASNAFDLFAHVDASRLLGGVPRPLSIWPPAMPIAAPAASIVAHSVLLLARLGAAGDACSATSTRPDRRRHRALPS